MKWNKDGPSYECYSVRKRVLGHSHLVNSFILLSLVNLLAGRHQLLTVYPLNCVNSELVTAFNVGYELVRMTLLLEGLWVTPSLPLDLTTLTMVMRGVNSERICTIDATKIANSIIEEIRKRATIWHQISGGVERAAVRSGNES